MIASHVLEGVKSRSKYATETLLKANTQSPVRITPNRHYRIATLLSFETYHNVGNNTLKSCQYPRTRKY